MKNNVSAGSVVNLGVKDLFRSVRRRPAAGESKGKSGPPPGARPFEKGVWLVPLQNPSPRALGADASWAMADGNGRMWAGQIIAESGGRLVDIHRSDYGSACVSKLFQLLKTGKIRPFTVGVGLCGALDPSLKRGDFIVADAVSLLGLAKPGREKFSMPDTAARPSKRLADILCRTAEEEAGCRGAAVARGLIASSRLDSEDELAASARRAARGALALEMESFAFLSHAARAKYSTQSAVLLCVSNSIVKGEDLSSVSAKEPATAKMRREMVETLNRIAIRAILNASGD